MANEPDGKVVYQYVGDTSGIDKANAEAEKKIEDGSTDIEKAASSTASKTAESAENAAKSAEDSVEKAKTGIGGHLDAIKAASGMAFTAAGAAALAFGKRGIELASDLTEVQNVVDTVFGSNASKINTFAQNAAKSFGLSELSAKQYTSTLGAMLKSMGLSSDETLNMSEKMTGLAGDFASFYNLDPADAFEKIRSGISGETEPLKELGINMDQTNLQTFAMSQGIKESVQNMTQAQLATLRYNYLLSVSKDAQGDYAKTSNSVANEQRTVGMQFDQISAKVGSALLPVLNKLLTLLLQVLTPVLNFVQAHPKVTAGIMAVMVALGLLGGTLTFTSSILPVLNGMLGTTALTTGIAGTTAAGTAISFGALALAMLATVAIIVAVIAVVVLVATHWKQIGQVAQTVGNAIKGAFLGALDGIKAAWNGITGFFTGIWNGLKAGVTAAGNGIKAAAVTAWNGIRTAIMAVVQPFITGVVNLWNGMKTGIQTIMIGLQNILGGIWTIIKNIFAGALLLLIDLVTGNFGKLHDDAIKIFTNIQQGFAQIWEGIKQVFSGALEAIKGFCAVEWNGIVNTATTIWNGLVGFFSGLPGRIGGIMSTVGSLVRSVWDDLIGFIRSVPGRFMSGLSGLGSAIRGAFSDAISFITHLPSEALQWGKDIVQGIADGIKGAAKAVGDAVNGVAQDIRSFLHFSQPDKGPLREFPEWPRDMMQTWADELSGNDTVVLSAVKKVTGNMANTVQAGTGTSIARAVSASSTSANMTKGATTVDNSVTKAPVQNFYGPVNLADKGSVAATLQQTQFVAPI